MEVWSFYSEKYNIEILTTKGTDIAWKDLDQIALITRNKEYQGDLDLSNPKKRFEFDSTNFNEICEKLRDYIKIRESELNQEFNRWEVV